MGIEIERKFIVNQEKWAALNNPLGDHYVQAYLNERGATVRIRISAACAWLTIKGKEKLGARSEFEYLIPIEDARAMVDELAVSVLEKWRFKLNIDGLIWEIDTFSKDQNGIVMAEVELDDISQNVELPDWIESEVTGDFRYSNSNMAKKIIKD